MIQLDTITLENFVWQNQRTRSNVAAKERRAMNGALKVSVTKLNELPITLQADLEPAAIFEQLHAHSESNLGSFNLTVQGQTLSVRWDYTKGAVTGQPYRAYSDAAPDYYQNIQLFLVTV